MDTQFAQRAVEFRGQEQHKESIFKGNPAIQQAYTEGDSDQANGNRRQKFEHRSGEKGKTQYLHGSFPVPLADPCDARAFRVAAVEELQRR